MSIFQQPPGTMPEIQHLWAFVAFDPTDQNEGVLAFYSPVYDAILPLIAADEKRLEQMRHIAQQQVNAGRAELVKLVKFTTREEIGTITPEGR